MTSPKKNEKIEKELSNNITNSKEDIGNIENLNHLNTNDYINHQATIRNNSNPVCWFCNNNIYPVEKRPGLGYLCLLCVEKMKCFQMY